MGKEKHVEEHQQVLEENRTAQFPDFPKRRMTDDAAERSENDERKKRSKTHEPANSQKPYHTVKTGFVNNPRTNR